MLALRTVTYCTENEETPSFADQQWIERLAELQDRNSLTDVQAAKYLGIEESEFQSVKAGKKSLCLKSKSILLFPDAER